MIVVKAYEQGFKDGYAKKEKELEDIGSIDEANIRQAVSTLFQIPWHRITDIKRKRECVLPKQVYCYLARRLTAINWREIAQAVGHEKHSYAIHSARTIADLIEYDPQLKNQIDHLLNKLSHDTSSRRTM